MRYISVAIVVTIMIFTSTNTFGQKVMNRSLNQQTKSTKEKTVVGAFGETIEIKQEAKEQKQEQERYFDLAEETIDMNVLEAEEVSKVEKELSNINLMDIMVINERNPWNQAPPKSEAFLFHTATKITNESGFYIQLLESDQILEKEHKIYQEFGNLRVKEKPSNHYNYLIGNFLSEETGNKFLKDIILPRYPNAKLIKLSEGEIL